MAKTVINIIQELTSKGHDVTYYVRKDGGVLIRSIDGTRFSGAKGNTVARSLVGESLSTKRAVQLESATRKRQSFIEEYGKDIYKRYKQVARKWRKAKLPAKAGKISFKKFKRLVKDEGLAKALRALSEKEKYATGIAYGRNVEILAMQVERYGDMTGYDEFLDLSSDIMDNMDNIKEDSIAPAYAELYRLNTEPLTDELVDEVIKNVRNILGI